MDALDQRSEAPLEIGVSEILGQAQQADRRFEWVGRGLAAIVASATLHVGISTVFDGAVETKESAIRGEIGGVFLAVEPPQLALLVPPLGEANELGRKERPAAIRVIRRGRLTPVEG